MVDDEREPAGANQHERGEGARNTAIAVLEGVYLYESVVQPRSREVGRNFQEVLIVGFYLP